MSLSLTHEIKERLDRIIKYENNASNYNIQEKKQQQLLNDILILYDVCNDISMTLTLARKGIFHSQIVPSEKLDKIINAIPHNLDILKARNSLFKELRVDVEISWDYINLILSIPTYFKESYKLKELIPIISAYNQHCYYPILTQRQFLQKDDEVFAATKCDELSCVKRLIPECLTNSVKFQEYQCVTATINCPREFEQRINKSLNYLYVNEEKKIKNYTLKRGSYFYSTDQRIDTISLSTWESSQTFNNEPLKFSIDADDLTKELERLDEETSRQRNQQITHGTLGTIGAMVLIYLSYRVLHLLCQRRTPNLGEECKDDDLSLLATQSPPAVLMKDSALPPTAAMTSASDSHTHITELYCINQPHTSTSAKDINTAARHSAPSTLQ